MKRLFKIFVALLAIVGVFSLLSSIFSEDQIVLGERVGVVRVTGFISDAGEAAEALEYFRNDEEVKAVVLRVVTPGGVVAPSQKIHDEVARTAEIKPVVASFGSVAASGGYYLSAPSTRIVASPGTITGSIGVIMQFQEYEVLLDKLGLRSRTIKSGPFKDAGSPLREMSEEERGVMQSVVDDLFDQFVEAIAEGRGMEKEEVLALADGRIYSGRQAFELGLIDKLGGYREAVELAGELADITGRPEVEIWKKPKSGLLHIVLGDDAEGAVEKVAAPLSASPARYLLPGWGW